MRIYLTCLASSPICLIDKKYSKERDETKLLGSSLYMHIYVKNDWLGVMGMDGGVKAKLYAIPEHMQCHSMLQRTLFV